MEDLNPGFVYKDPKTGEESPVRCWSTDLNSSTLYFESLEDFNKWVSSDERPGVLIEDMRILIKAPEWGPDELYDTTPFLLKP